MYPFFESIKILDSQVCHWGLHKERIRCTLQHYFQAELRESFLDQAIRGAPAKGIYKLRLAYNAEGFTMEYIPYRPKEINQLHIVHADDIIYNFKYTNRNPLIALVALVDQQDEIIIIQKGLVTDTSFSNLAFYDGTKWFTPKHPLLKGIKRKYLIETGLLQAADISLQDISSFSKVSLINALLELDELSLPIEKINFHRGLIH